MAEENKKQLNSETQKKDWKAVIWDWTESIVVALILALIIRTFVVQAFKIPTGSMQQTLLVGDAILVNKFLYGVKIPFTDWRLPAFKNPQRGDVVVFIYPEDPKKDFIKRLIATEGETVEIRNGSIYVNNKPLVDPVFRSKYYYNMGNMSAGKKITVPKDSYFVLGDNSASSQDSRYWGFVPHKNILGKAMVVYWPPLRIRLIK